MEAMPQGWLAAAQAGDADAAEQLITAYHARVFAFLRRLCGNESDAEDLTQRTFARVWTSLGTFAGRSSVSSWIHGIAHHVYLDWRRSDHRAEPQTDDWWASCPESGPGPSEIAVSADLASAAYAAVDRLDAESRSAVHLHYYQGLTLQETAEALDVSVGTVKNRLRSALEELQSRLGRESVVPPTPQPHPRRS
jgi:RNA polymerase sigma-70 factor (ECF subfamily)